MQNKNIRKLSGMQIFTLIWFGQFVSVMGTAMTRFALMIWAFDKIGKASTTALLGFFSIVPYIILSPIAGVVVDRYSRKKIMIFSDLASAIVTASILLLFVLGKLQVWHLFIAEAFSGGFEAFQIPAYSSAITMLIPKDQYTRASGMRSLSSNSSRIFAPILAGVLMALIGIKGVMIIDLATFFVGFITLIAVSIPNPQFGNEKTHKESSILNDIKFGFGYLFERKGLLYLMFIFVGINLLAALTYFGILPAMILSRTMNSKMVLASIQSALGIGGVVGSIIVSIWGCPKKKIVTILFAGCGSFMLGDILLSTNSSVYIWYIGAFLSAVFLPFLSGAENALWQSKIEPSIQGRIFSIKGMIQLSTMPLGYLLGGILADYVFEPAMVSGGSMSHIFSWIVGTGKGSGMAVMFLFTGILGSITCLAGYLVKEVRNIETDLPDHDIILESIHQEA